MRMSMGWLGWQLRMMASAFPSFKKKNKKPTEPFQSGANSDPGDIVTMALQTPVGKPDPGISNRGWE